MTDTNFSNEQQQYELPQIDDIDWGDESGTAKDDDVSDFWADAQTASLSGVAYQSFYFIPNAVVPGATSAAVMNETKSIVGQLNDELRMRDFDYKKFRETNGPEIPFPKMLKIIGEVICRAKPLGVLEVGVAVGYQWGGRGPTRVAMG